MILIHQHDQLLLIRGKLLELQKFEAVLAELVIANVSQRLMQHSAVGKLLKTFCSSRRSLHYGPCNKLFVGGLSFDTNEKILKEAFEKYGIVLEAKVICDHVSSKSKGYGFVQFVHESDATRALNEMNDLLLDGWKLRVAYAKKHLDTQGSDEDSNLNLSICYVNILIDLWKKKKIQIIGRQKINKN